MQAITFDFHNTLIRCDPWFELEVRELPVQVAERLTEQGQLVCGGLDPAEIRTAYSALRKEIVGHGREMDAVAGTVETFRRLGFQVGPTLIAPIVDELNLVLVDAAEPLSGVVETITFLASSGVPLGVISSAVHHDFLEWALQRHGLRDAFTVVNTSASTGFYKSRPEIYTTTFADLGVPGDRVVHVGDSFRYDHWQGQRAGARTVWLNEDATDRPEDGPEPTLELRTLVGAGPVLLDLLSAA